MAEVRELTGADLLTELVEGLRAAYPGLKITIDFMNLRSYPGCTVRVSDGTRRYMAEVKLYWNGIEVLQRPDEDEPSTNPFAQMFPKANVSALSRGMPRALLARLLASPLLTKVSA